MTDVNIDSIMDTLRGSAHSPADLLKRVSAIGEALGYDHTALAFVPDKTIATSQISQATYSDRWQSESSSLPLSEVLRDPVLQHLGTRPDPIVWSEKQYVKANLAGLYERFHGHGIGSGLAVSVRAPSGSSVCLGFSNRERNPHGELPGAKEFGVLFLSATAALNILDVPRVVAAKDLDSPRLTKREIECLKWSRLGKTAWETSVILSISQATATFHLKNAIFKLDAVNKTHAVMRAVDLGLI
jgi:DNA-binding CsgD family transcriptional regulator